jgi:hypothetical protein
MGNTYHFGIAKLIVHISHIIIGLWLVYLGYKKITNTELDNFQYNLLTGLGVVLFLYFTVVTYKEYGNKWNYAFGVPNYLIFLTHLINSVLFFIIGMRYLNINKLISLYLIIAGSMGALYHAHLMFFM